MARKTALSALMVSVDDIAARAYQIYMDRGRADGFDREDWLRAECELTARASATPACHEAQRNTRSPRYASLPAMRIACWHG